MNSNINNSSVEVNFDLADKLYNILNAVYEATKEYRSAFIEGNEKAIVISNNNLNFSVRDLYSFYERYSSSSSLLANKAIAVVNAYNEYGKYYNVFANSTDRLSAMAQEYAKHAEDEFEKVVELITTDLNELEPLIKGKEKEREIYNQTVTNNYTNNINVNMETNISTINVNISNVVNNAKKAAEQLNLEEKVLKDIYKKLDEIENAAKEKKPKESTWKKLKGILKWLAEQSVQVAGVVVPVLVAVL